MANPIVPSVGRVVLYVQTDSHITSALVTRVHSENCINLMAMIDGEGAQPRTSVSYDEGKGTGTWHWMAYQVQADAARKEVQPDGKA